MQTKTFQNLMILQQCRDTVKELLQGKYHSVIGPLKNVILMTMRVNEENHFEAVKRIQDKTTLMNSPEDKTLFSAALMELVEEINLKELKNE
jgi:hypothetical protein